VIHSELHQAFRAYKPRAHDHAARRRAILRRGVGAAPAAIKVDLDMLRANDNLDLLPVGHARCQEMAERSFGQGTSNCAAYHVDIAKEGDRAAIHRGVVDILGRALLNNLPVPHQGNLIGHAHRLFGLVGDQQDRRILFAQDIQRFIADTIAQTVIKP
jgi:hypothetical protein